MKDERFGSDMGGGRAARRFGGVGGGPEGAVHEVSDLLGKLGAAPDNAKRSVHPGTPVCRELRR